MVETNDTGPSPTQSKPEDKSPQIMSPLRVVGVGISLSKYSSHRFFLFFNPFPFSHSFPPVVLGMIGFYRIPGLIVPDATGNPFVNAFYCSVMTLTT